MAESPQFETLVQSLSSTLQSLEQKRKELKKQGHSTGIWVGGIILVIGIAFFPLCPCSTYWNRYCGRSCFVGILQLYKCQIAGVIHLL